MNGGETDSAFDGWSCSACTGGRRKISKIWYRGAQANLHYQGGRCSTHSYSLTHWFTHSLTHSMIYLLTHSLTCLITHSYLLTRSLTHPLDLAEWIIQCSSKSDGTVYSSYSRACLYVTHCAWICPVIHSPTHSLTHSLARSLTHSLTYLLARLGVVAINKMVDDLNWSESQKGFVLSSFYIGYAIGQMPSNR